MLGNQRAYWQELCLTYRRPRCIGYLRKQQYWDLEFGMLLVSHALT